jgi:hypothetical protein
VGKPRHTKEQVQQRFTEAARVIRECLLAAWRDYRTKYPAKSRLIHSGRSRASLFVDHVLDHLRKRVTEIPNAKLVKFRGLTVLVVNDEFTVKIAKKLTRRLLTRGLPTDQNVAFMTHDPQGAFGFFKDRTSLIVGYVLDELAAAIYRTVVVCPNGLEQNYWHYEIQDEAPAGAIEPAPPAPGDSYDFPFTVDGEESDEGESQN